MSLSDKYSKQDTHLFLTQWFYHYPMWAVVIYDNGTEFLGHPFQTLLDTYIPRIYHMPKMVENPYGNSVVECIHLTMGDMIFMTPLCWEDLKEFSDEVLQNIGKTLFSTIDTSRGYEPGHLAFGHDLIFNTKVRVDWENLKNKRLANSVRQN